MLIRTLFPLPGRIFACKIHKEGDPGFLDLVVRSFRRPYEGSPARFRPVPGTERQIHRQVLFIRERFGDCICQFLGFHRRTGGEPVLGCLKETASRTVHRSPVSPYRGSSALILVSVIFELNV